MRLLCALCALCLAVPACGSAKSTPDTSARRCVLGFCEALIEGDLAAAHELLHPETRKRLDRQQFAAAARAYLSIMQFRPDAVGLRACDEKGDEATGHVAFIGHADGKSRRYRDAFVLKKAEEGWRVVLPAAWVMN